MKVTLSLFVFVALFIAVYAIEEAYYEQAFAQFMIDHSRIYENEEVKMHRYEIFKRNLDFIDNHNQQKSTFSVAINQFADLTNAEYRSKYLTFRASKKSFRSLTSPTNHVGDLPKTVDWRKKKAVSYVKDQGDCGSCWAFSTSGAIEGTNAIKTNKLIELSEQNIIDCSWNSPYSNDGCDGGDMRNALQYIIDNKGIESEDDYPYIDYNGGDKHKCKYTVTKRIASITAMVNVSQGNETDLAYAIVQSPVSVAIDASQTSFQFYSGGIYYEPFCHNDLDSLDHGVLAVGYGDGYYEVKNSWGPGWGFEGYIMMSRNEDNNCGIATYATYALA
jgi:cathepsin L